MFNKIYVVKDILKKYILMLNAKRVFGKLTLPLIVSETWPSA